MSQAHRTLPGIAVVPYRFVQTAVAATQSAVALQVGQVAGTDSNEDTVTANLAVTGYTLPAPGEVLYVTADTAVSLADDEVSGIGIVDRGNPVTFAAGSVLGVDLTTDEDWDATTADLVVTVYVALWL
jgi:hypothetical protein